MTAEQLRSLRLSVDASQAETAWAVGITPSALSQAERGLTQLTEEHADAVRAFVAERREILKRVKAFTEAFRRSTENQANRPSSN